MWSCRGAVVDSYPRPSSSAAGDPNGSATTWSSAVVIIELLYFNRWVRLEPAGLLTQHTRRAGWGSGPPAAHCHCAPPVRPAPRCTCPGSGVTLALLASGVELRA